jgi:signal transduction histidine kinase/CheY-like chemotaxis protein/HPt (histidine-containing phosphotransfer) domain-containing protein
MAQFYVNLTLTRTRTFVLHHPIKRMNQYLEKLPKNAVAALGLVLIILLGFVDYATGTEITFSIFYLVPISLTSWYVGRWQGILACLISTLTWLTADVLVGLTFSHTLVMIWNGTIRFLILAMLAIMLSELKIFLRREKEARESAVAAADFKSAFLANVSHEIRTPLNAILGMAEMLAGTRLTKDQSLYVRTFQTQGHHLLKLINDILDLSRVEAGHVQIREEPFDVRELVESVVSVMSAPARERGLEISCRLTPEVPEHLLGDPESLRRVLINLFGNGVKFTEKGSVVLSVETDPETSKPGHLRFSVADTGMGVPPDKLEAIFERFYRMDSPWSRQQGGTGLGLYISRHLVTVMGGKMWVESNINHGSTFHFTVPLKIYDVPEAERLTDVEARLRITPVHRRALRILFAEDHEANRLIIKSFLKDTPYRIDVAENGEIAINKFRSSRYDLVLMDMEMPVMDGYGSTREIRSWEREAGIAPTPILALTASAFEEDIRKCLDAGCTDHLAKPMSKTQLLEKIDGLTQTTAEAEVTERVHEQKVTIRGNNQLKDLIPGFLQDTSSVYKGMKECLAKNDYQNIRTMAHRMRGAGGSFGFQQISDIGENLERAAENRDRDRIQDCLRELSVYLERVEVVYE